MASVNCGSSPRRVGTAQELHDKIRIQLRQGNARNRGGASHFFRAANGFDEAGAVGVGKHPIQGGEHAHLDIIGSLPELGSRVKTESETAERANRWQF